MMNNRMILTPFFLDQAVPALEDVAGEDWWSNKPQLPAGEAQERMVQLYRPLAAMVQTAVNKGERPVSVAGDCCTTIGVLAGLQQAQLNPTLIWFDAHGDFNTWETTPSGFLGGMPLAMLVGLGELTMGQAVGLTSLPEPQVILTDARDLDPGERSNVERSAINHLADVTMLLDSPLPAGPLYVHFDADVINNAQAPAMSYPTEGGPSLAALGRVFDHLADSGQIAAVSLSAWNPDLDQDGRSREAVLRLLQRLIR
jgi:arginase